MNALVKNVSVVVIGRNEGERLVRCLDAIKDQNLTAVYVDSGSTDESVDYARANGVSVVELDMSVPFTAARARNAGVAGLLAKTKAVEFIQFLDGDCHLDADWIGHGLTAMTKDPRLGIVTGWRSELHPERSVYNAICDIA